VSEAESLLEGVAAGAVAAHKADASQALIDTITARRRTGGHCSASTPNGTAHPSRPPSQGGNRAGRFILRLGYVRRVATRYDKLGRRYEAFIAIASA
jgi:hypothetical protein